MLGEFSLVTNGERNPYDIVDDCGRSLPWLGYKDDPDCPCPFGGSRTVGLTINGKKLEAYKAPETNGFVRDGWGDPDFGE
ncbi:MAG: hypothetical protein HYW26_04970 [Candidatus Aenigmarchaeota archaeon]|nr:hypothetical protein [Candidatus Aenigmarchaeota archaeon]